MKTEKGHPRPAIMPADAKPTVLDWPRDGAQVDEFLAKVESRLRRRRRRRIAASSTLIALILVIMLWGVPYVRDTGTVLTPPGLRQELALADGSHAELNAQTHLRTDFRYGRRIVQLDRGEAFFTVAKDTAHPFFVETPAGTIRVTGTQFNVRLTGSGSVEVTLMTGSVTVQNGPTAFAKLVPNQQLVFGSNASSLRTLAPGTLENTVAWRKGLIVLDGLTLAEAVERLAEFHGRKIEVAPEVAALRPGGVFPIDDLQGFLTALETALSVRVLAAPDGTYRIVAGSSH